MFCTLPVCHLKKKKIRQTIADQKIKELKKSFRGAVSKREKCSINFM